MRRSYAPFLPEINPSPYQAPSPISTAILASTRWTSRTAYASSTITCLPQFPVTFGTTASTAPVVATVASLTPVATQTSLNPTQYFFYTPEKSLLSHTTIESGGGRPTIETDYIWFAGLPVAQEGAAVPHTRFTFPDHLGTPFLQTTNSGARTWQVEYDPYGTVYRTRTGMPSDQRLRFPGQEYDEQTPERAYNIFRWYRVGWGRYTQMDLDRDNAPFHPYDYANGNPLRWSDPRGLKAFTMFETPPNPIYAWAGAGQEVLFTKCDSESDRQC